MAELKAATLPYEEKRDSRIYLFHNVPAKVCSACGEMWMDEAVLQRSDRLIETGGPVRKVETPVYDFARTTAPSLRVLCSTTHAYRDNAR